MSTEAPMIFTATSAFSLLGVVGILTSAYLVAKAVLPKHLYARRQDRYTFIWFMFNALIHFSFEGSWLYLSMFGRQVNTSEGMLAEMWKEYTRADYRWGTADPTVVSLELLTVLGAGPLAFYIAYLLSKNDPARYYWIIVVCTAELYGGWITFCPEWLTGSENLNTSNALYLWVYLFFLNTIWVFIPLALLVHAYTHVAGSLRAVQNANSKKQI